MLRGPRVLRRLCGEAALGEEQRKAGAERKLGRQRQWTAPQTRHGSLACVGVGSMEETTSTHYVGGAC